MRATLEIVTTLRVPRRLYADRDSRDDRSAPLSIVSRISLIAGSSRIEIVTEVENAAEDHRLRVLFTAPIYTDWSHAEGQFEVTRRAIDLDPMEVGRVPGPDEEVAVTTFPQGCFVDVNDGARGMAVLNRGLPEYEAMRSEDGTTIALTLLRAVGWLSRPDLSTRNGNAGPMLPTPEAQCPGRHVFEYAIVSHNGDWSSARVPDEGERFAAPPIGGSLVAKAGHSRISNGSTPRRSLPEVFSLAAVMPHEVMLSTIKRAGDAAAVIVRVYNTVDRPVQTRITFGWPVKEVAVASMAEIPLDQPLLAVDEQRAVTFELAAHEIRTLRVT